MIFKTAVKGIFLLKFEQVVCLAGVPAGAAKASAENSLNVQQGLSES